jgi:putative FmdB family regulatory protein
MPVYEYLCQDCGHSLEALQKITDAPLALCEKCGGRLKKLISRTSFQLKGTGWYASDYKPAPAAAPKTGETDKSTAKKPEEKTTTGNGASTNTDSAKNPEKKAVSSKGSDNKS